MRRNFGLWAYHEDPRPGVLVHVSKTGEKVWTVRAGTQRILDVFTLRTVSYTHLDVYKRQVMGSSRQLTLRWRAE